MKKSYLITPLILLLLATAFQASAQQVFSFAVAAGANYTTIKGSDGTILRGNLGFWGKYDVMENFSTHIGLLYSANGSEIKVGTTTVKIKSSWLQVPFYAGYTFYKNENLTISGLGGAYVGLMLSVSSEPAGGVEEDTPLDFGLALGGDVEINKTFAVRLTYNYGLPSTVYTGFKSLGGNRYFQLGFVYYIFRQ